MLSVIIMAGKGTKLKSGKQMLKASQKYGQISQHILPNHNTATNKNSGIKFLL